MPPRNNARMTTFAEFIRDHAHRTDDPAGDFIEDARGEIAAGRFEPLSDSWDHIELHLGLRHACFEAIEAARVVYRRWRRWLR